MTLSDIVREYCKEHGVSYRRFADMCGLTSGYITMLVKGENPNTGKPLRPTIDTYVKLADGMGITVSELFKRPRVQISPPRPKKVLKTPCFQDFCYVHE